MYIHYYWRFEVYAIEIDEKSLTHYGSQYMKCNDCEWIVPGTIED